MSTVENPHAGQGSVVLDIGGDIGALVVTVPAAMDGLEVEIVPTGTAHHHHHHDDHDEHDDSDPHGGGHTHGPDAPPHVAVVGRPVGDRIVHCLVYGELAEGTYDLYVRPDGPVRLTASVTGGQVTEAEWPAGD